MKLLITFLALVNGGYMLADGLFVILKGKYIGPERPGPWANIFYKLDIDVFKLGPLFIIFGLLWLTLLYGLWTNQNWAYVFGLIISILTLWYFTIGSIISIIVLILLLTCKSKLGL